MEIRIGMETDGDGGRAKETYLGELEGIEAESESITLILDSGLSHAAALERV